MSNRITLIFYFCARSYIGAGNAQSIDKYGETCNTFFASRHRIHKKSLKSIIRSQTLNAHTHNTSIKELIGLKLIKIT